MNSHKNARLTFARRVELVGEHRAVPACHERRARKPTGACASGWNDLGAGPRSLRTRPPSRPLATLSLKPGTVLAVLELRTKRPHMPYRRALSVAGSTAGQLLKRAAAAAERSRGRRASARHEHPAPGDMLHIGIKIWAVSSRLSHGQLQDAVPALAAKFCRGPLATARGSAGGRTWAAAPPPSRCPAQARRH